MQSTVLLKGKKIDNRLLHLELEYFQLTKQESDQLLLSFVEWHTQLFSASSILDWIFKNKHVKPEALKENIKNHAAILGGFEGVVKSEEIPNTKALRRYRKNDIFPPMGSHVTRSYISEDYFPFYQEKVEALNNGKTDWKGMIQSFFDEPGRICVAHARLMDLQGIIVRIPYEKSPEIFRGQIHCYIHIYCLEDSIPFFVREFRDFLRKQALKLTNINGRVAVTPISFPDKCSGHMYYFNGNVTMDGSHIIQNCSPNEWYPYYYLCGAEWFNVISPLTQTHLLNKDRKNDNVDDLIVEKLPNGCMTVQVGERPDMIDVKDLSHVKEFLYDALYPGMERILKDIFLNRRYTGATTKPRKDWVCVPVFEHEIIITDNEIIFKHGNCKLNDTDV